MLAAEGRQRVREELAQRCVDLMAAVELADTRTRAVVEKDGVVEEYGLRASDWNRVVAVARGYMSQKTRESLDRFHARSFREASGR